MRCWHGTNEPFAAFSEEMFGSRPDASPNGALGAWVFFEEGLADRFGAHVLTIDADIERSIGIEVGAMMKDHIAAGSDREEALAFFRNRRAALLAEGHQAIFVLERDGRKAMGVILDISCIRTIEAVPSAGYAAPAMK